MPLDQCIKSSISLYPSTFRSSHSVLSWYPRSARSQWQTSIILRTQSRSSDIQLTVLPGNNFAAINCEFFNTSHPDHALIKNICFSIYLYFVFLRAEKRRGDKFVKQLRGCISWGTTNNSVLSTELIMQIDKSRDCNKVIINSIISKSLTFWLKPFPRVAENQEVPTWKFRYSNNSFTHLDVHSIGQDFKLDTIRFPLDVS